MPHEPKQKLNIIIERLREDIVSLRTGRATPALVENLEVEYYGTKTPLKALASIISSGSRELVIQPWDKQAVQPIERAIQSSSLGLNPITDRDAIRLSIPVLTEERRRELTKLLHQYTEEARIHLRRASRSSRHPLSSASSHCCGDAQGEVMGVSGSRRPKLGTRLTSLTAQVAYRGPASSNACRTLALLVRDALS